MTPEQAQTVISTLARIDERLKHMADKGKDHEHRIRNIEKKQWAFFGGASIVASVAAFASRYWEKLS